MVMVVIMGLWKFANLLISLSNQFGSICLLDLMSPFALLVLLAQNRLMRLMGDSGRVQVL